MTDLELYHHGVKGMKWGRRKQNIATDKTSRKQKALKRIKSSRTGSELVNRGKSAIDVLVNGDKDWMGRSISSDNAFTEARNRGKAAIERLLYSEEQIHNKKFFGKYNPFG